MEKNRIIKEIHTKIFFVRNQRVIIDSEAALLYAISIKQLKSAVRKNAKRFPKTFAFQLTKKEWRFFKTQMSVKIKYIKTPPYVFTLSGIAMLSNVLDGKKALSISANIAKSFTEIFAQYSKTMPLWIDENNKEFKTITKGLCAKLKLIKNKK
ncbi:MAG: ORF6N domain-containing protein [Elusimicrobiota bacterium]|nr:ORF6N domain-containing protein [Elusimicrobiota bacterium]